MTLTIKNATFINGKKQSITLKDGKLLNIGTEIKELGKVINLPEDTYVSTGWIDIHTHAYPKFEPYCAKPDAIGYETGVATVVDAGSTGAKDFNSFLKNAHHAKTNVFAFLNISKIGLSVRDELADISNIDFELIRQFAKKYVESIVGLKVRMSKSVIGSSGMTPLKQAKEIARELDLPLMVHIGNAPPKLADILSVLDKGDIVTHCFNEKPNNHIFALAGENLRALKAAIDRGVYLDIGHGTSSFSFDIARQAKKEEIPFHSISTDIYERNQTYGPVYNLATTLTKFLALGYPLEQLIDYVTINPAKMLRRKELAELTIGKKANLTFFQVKNEEITLRDSLGNKLISPRQIVPYAVYVGGSFYELQGDEDSENN